MTMRNKNLALFVAGFLLAVVLASSAAAKPAIVTPTPKGGPSATRTATRTPTVVPTATPVAATNTATATSPVSTVTATAAASATSTVLVPTPTVANTATPSGAVTPYVGAPACATHDNSTYHTLWNGALGCHYDHEHGQDPYTAQVAAAFPGFDLRALNCGVEIGHCNPSSPMENTMKHGGMKFQVDTSAPNGCAVGFEGGTVAVDAYAIQYHAFGPPEIELEARIHSAAFLVRQCQPGNPNDKGYVYVVQHVDYGQMVIPYQGIVAPYPNRPNPAYDSALAPYWSNDCVGPVIQCRSSLQFIRDRNLNVNAVVTSKSGFRTGATEVIALLWRYRDGYQVFDFNDQVHPFTYRWICGDVSYVAVGCRWNNSTTTIHELQLHIPGAWDNLPGFDSDPRVGRITASGYTALDGSLNVTCTAPGPGCFPIVMQGAFVGFTSSEVSVNKVSNPTTVDTPERDIYFCGGVVCSETSPGAVPSGWIGDSN